MFDVTAVMLRVLAAPLAWWIGRRKGEEWGAALLALYMGPLAIPFVLVSSGRWKECGGCGGRVPRGYKVCRGCGHSMAPAEVSADREMAAAV